MKSRRFEFEFQSFSFMTFPFREAMNPTFAPSNGLNISTRKILGIVNVIFPHNKKRLLFQSNICFGFNTNGWEYVKKKTIIQQTFNFLFPFLFRQTTFSWCLTFKNSQENVVFFFFFFHLENWFLWRKPVKTRWFYRLRKGSINLGKFFSNIEKKKTQFYVDKRLQIKMSVMFDSPLQEARCKRIQAEGDVWLLLTVVRQNSNHF